MLPKALATSRTMASEGNEGEQKPLEDHHEEPRPIPEPQYRDCEIDAFYVEKRYVAVRQITVGANGEPLEGYRHYLRLSRHGVERVQTADLFAKPMERIRVRNCTLFKNGEAAGEDALKKGAFFGSVATLFSFHPLAIDFLATRIFGHWISSTTTKRNGFSWWSQEKRAKTF